MRIKQFYNENKNIYGRKIAIKNLLKYSLQKLAGVSEYQLIINNQQEQLNTLFYFLNLYNDIQEAPKAKGRLRQVQECDAIFLEIFDKICKKNGIEYWITAGTLLGAYRHGGFIPWDDDMDVNMMLDEFKKAVPILKKEFECIGADFYLNGKYPFQSMGFGFKKTGVWLDVFPCFFYDFQNGEYKDEGSLKKQLSIWSFETLKEGNDNSFDGLKGLFYDRTRINTNCSVVDLLPSIPGNAYMAEANAIFPISEITFEEKNYPSPNVPEGLFKSLYGNDFMSFPRKGVLHHGDKPALPNDIPEATEQMELIKKELISIRDSIR